MHWFYAYFRISATGVTPQVGHMLHNADSYGMSTIRRSNSPEDGARRYEFQIVDISRLSQKQEWIFIGALCRDQKIIIIRD